MLRSADDENTSVLILMDIVFSFMGNLQIMIKTNRIYYTLFLAAFVFSLSLSSCTKKKADLIVKDWKASKLNFSGSEIGGDIVSLEYSFKNDGSFSRAEDGKVEKGKWSISEDEKKLILDLDDKSKVQKDINELAEDKLVLSGEEHGMMRTETFEGKK
jgi:hypothetical protein